LSRKFLLNHVTEGKKEVTGRRGISHRQLLDYVKGKRGYWKSKGEALDCTLWRTHFGRGCGLVVIQNT